MNNIIIVFAACFALASCGVSRPRPPREAPSPSTESPLSELGRHAAEFQKTFSAQVSALASDNNTAALNHALKEGSDAVLRQLSAFSASLQSALSDANGKMKAALEQTRGSVARAAEELRAAHPDVEQHANALKQQIEKAVSTAVAETQKLATQLTADMEQTNEKLAPKIKEAYNDFVKGAQQVQKKLHEAANKQQ